MRIAIISDAHDNIPNLQKVLNYCAKNEIKNIICCGDLGDQETLDFLNDNFEGEIFLVWGNVERDHFESYKAQNTKHKQNTKYKKTKIFEDFGEAEFKENSSLGSETSKLVAFAHYPREAKELAESGKYDFVFYGHTHKPWSSFAKASEGQARKCMMLNPGNVAGIIYAQTFAVWETDNDKFDLIRVHDLK